MNRRTFLRASSLVTAGALITGPAALEAFERLTWKRRLFAGWSGMPRRSPPRAWIYPDNAKFIEAIKRIPKPESYYIFNTLLPEPTQVCCKGRWS